MRYLPGNIHKLSFIIVAFTSLAQANSSHLNQDPLRIKYLRQIYDDHRTAKALPKHVSDFESFVQDFEQVISGQQQNSEKRFLSTDNQKQEQTQQNSRDSLTNQKLGDDPWFPEYGWAPSSWDWRTQNIISEVRDGSSESIKGFASIPASAIEAHYALKYKKQVTLSVQQLRDCVRPQDDRIDPWTSFQVVKQLGGIAFDENYPMLGQGKKQDCYYSLTIPSVNIQSDGYVFVTQDETKLLSVIYNKGPVVSAMSVNDQFYNYKSGIISDVGLCGTVVPNLSVLIVGYGSENGKDFWIVQAPLGKEWGENGYARIIRNQNLCGITGAPTIPIQVLDSSLEPLRPFQKDYVGMLDDARCLDGSFYTVYFSQGYGTGQNKAIVHFDGGGWAYGRTADEVIDSMAYRATTDLGSSNNYPDTDLGLDMWFQGDQKQDNLYYNWNRFFVKYCDGAGHQGYKKDPIIAKSGASLYLRGDTNTKALLAYLIQKVPPKSLDTFVLTGCSAGAQAAIYWADYFQQQLTAINEDLKFLAISNSGYFFDFKSVLTKDNDFAIRMQNLYAIANQEVVSPNDACERLIGSDKYLCLIAGKVLAYVNISIFMIQSGYDNWQIGNILDLTCIDPTVRTNKMYNCSFDEFQQMEYFRQQTLIELELQIINNNVPSGYWFPSCSFHCIMCFGTDEISFMYQVPMNSAKTLSNTINVILGQLGKQTDKNGVKVKNNHVYKDTVTWPLNSACAFETQNDRDIWN
eukprot:403336090